MASDDASAREKTTDSQDANKHVDRKASDKTSETAREPERGIEELYAAGDYAKTNAACTKEVVFSAGKLQKCALAACQTKNTALASRWLRAISKSARPEIIEACRGMGVELEGAPPAAPAPAPSSPPASAPTPTPAE